jgi:hypothetical protein
MIFGGSGGRYFTTIFAGISDCGCVLPTVIAGVFTLPASAKCVEWLRDAFRNRRVKRDAGKAAALELVPLLTKFPRECDSRWCCNEYQEPCCCDMPKLLPFPDNVTWVALPQKIAGAIRALPNEIDDSESDIRYEEYPGQRYESASRRYVLVGYRAVQLADVLRYHYGQGRYKSSTEYDFQSNLRRQRRCVYRSRLHRACDYVWYSRWTSRLKRRLHRMGKRISSITALAGAV